jgi:hypothetical protein
MRFLHTIPRPEEFIKELRQSSTTIAIPMGWDLALPTVEGKNTLTGNIV